MDTGKIKAIGAIVVYSVTARVLDAVKRALDRVEDFLETAPARVAMPGEWVGIDPPCGDVPGAAAVVERVEGRLALRYLYRVERCAFGCGEDHFVDLRPRPPVPAEEPVISSTWEMAQTGDTEGLAFWPSYQADPWRSV